MVFAYGGEFSLDAFIAASENQNAGAQWPAITNVALEAECGIYGPTTLIPGWLLPAEAPAEPCTDSNDNNDQGPPEASGHGGGLWGPDTFVASNGQIALDGPTLMGIEADGSAAMVGASTSDCETETCTWLSASTRDGVFHLQGLHVVVPSRMSFSEAGNTLLVDDFRLYLDGGADAPLVEWVPGSSSFSFAVGNLKAIVAGKLYGVPIHAEVYNTSKLTGIVRADKTGTFGITLDPVTFGLVDGMGNQWLVETSFDVWISHRRAPRARFKIDHVRGNAFLDASTSSDGDGDLLTFMWYVDGVEVGNRPLLRVPWPASGDSQYVRLSVTDSTGRNDWAAGWMHDEE